MHVASKLPLLMTFLSLLSTCAHPEEVAIRYADGNGNLYTIQNLRIDYAPVSAAMSSSGLYDGGQPQSAPVSKAQLKSLFHLLDDIQARSTDHAAQREKGTGRIEVITEETTESLLLKWRSGSQQELEAFLKALLPGQP